MKLTPDNFAFKREIELSKELCRAAQRLEAAQQLPASSGNLSARLDEETFIITPSGVEKRLLSPIDLIKMKTTGEILLAPSRYRPSMEWRMHAGVYKARPEISAIAHTHPVSAKALPEESGELDLSRVAIQEEAAYLGKIAVLPQLAAGSAELAQSVRETAEKGINTIILSAHGIVICASLPAAAANLAELFDRLLQAELLNRTIRGGSI